jgi:hypothetical protein
VISTVGIVLIKQGYLISIYGLGTIMKSKTLPKLNWKIIIISVLLIVATIEFSLRTLEK